MHITLETDYAIRIVDLLSRERPSEGNYRLGAKSIAEKTGVPARFALKILNKLVGGNIVVSYKGVRGGYELTKSPGEISLYDVVELVEGDYRFSRCLGDNYGCNCVDGLPCAYRSVFANITETVKSELKKQTFEGEKI